MKRFKDSWDVFVGRKSAGRRIVQEDASPDGVSRYRSYLGSGIDLSEYGKSTFTRAVIESHHGPNAARFAPFVVKNPGGEVDPTHRASKVLKTWHRLQNPKDAIVSAVISMYKHGRFAVHILRNDPDTSDPSLYLEDKVCGSNSTEQARILGSAISMRVINHERVEPYSRSDGGTVDYFSEPDSWRVRNNNGGMWKLNYLDGDSINKTEIIPYCDVAVWSNYRGDELEPLIARAMPLVSIDAKTSCWMDEQIDTGFPVNFEVSLNGSAEERKNEREVLNSLTGARDGILDTNGGKLKQVKGGVKEADWANTRKNAHETIALCTNFPAYLIGSEYSAESNVKEGRVDLLTHGLRLAEVICDVITPCLLTADEIEAGWTVSPDLDKVPEISVNKTAEAENESERASAMLQKIRVYKEAVEAGISEEKSMELSGLPIDRGLGSAV